MQRLCEAAGLSELHLPAAAEMLRILDAFSLTGLRWTCMAFFAVTAGIVLSICGAAALGSLPDAGGGRGVHVRPAHSAPARPAAAVATDAAAGAPPTDSAATATAATADGCLCYASAAAAAAGTVVLAAEERPSPADAASRRVCAVRGRMAAPCSRLSGPPGGRY